MLPSSVQSMPFFVTADITPKVSLEVAPRTSSRFHSEISPGISRIPAEVHPATIFSGILLEVSPGMSAEISQGSRSFLQKFSPRDSSKEVYKDVPLSAHPDVPLEIPQSSRDHTGNRCTDSFEISSSYSFGSFSKDSAGNSIKNFSELSLGFLQMCL